jgi:methylenetetrahydrofolate reductase (NADPH)
MQVNIGAALTGLQPTLSFEFFPPKTPKGFENLWKAIGRLEDLSPDFVSITYGAGGSTQEGTLAVVHRILAETALLPVMHLTCVGAARSQLIEFARELLDAGITNVLALRGDPPDGPGGTWAQAPGGLRYASDLVHLLRQIGPFCIGVAAFPEGHPESLDLDDDARWLAAKCLAGADFAITQFFFDATQYRDLVDRLRSHGCDTPVIPGVLPVTNPAQTRRFAQLAGATIPPDVDERFRAVEHDPAAVHDVGVEVARDLSRDLLALGAPGLHFYTLNRAASTMDVCAELRIDASSRGSPQRL